RPVVACVLATGFLLALALPALRMHVSKPSNESLSSQGEPALQTLARVRADFPATSAPAIVGLSGPSDEAAAVERAAGQLERLAVAQGIAHPPFTLNGGPDGRSGSLEIPLSGAGDNNSSKHAIALLRDQLVPTTLGRIPGVEVAVTGDTAEDVDFTNQMKHGVPYVIAFVLSLAFLLLLVAFRSI